MNLSKLNLTMGIIWLCVLAPLPAPAQDEAADKAVAVKKLTEFLQQNFNKFVPYQFKTSTNECDTITDPSLHLRFKHIYSSAVQILPVKPNLFEHEGMYYCGFQFTVPEWFDANFNMFFLLAKNEQNKDVIQTNFTWACIPKSGPQVLMNYCEKRPLSDYPVLKKQFPYTSDIIFQNVDEERLEPGRTYAIVFRFNQTNAQDIAFSISVDSTRGYKEFGIITPPEHIISTNEAVEIQKQTVFLQQNFNKFAPYQFKKTTDACPPFTSVTLRETFTNIYYSAVQFLPVKPNLFEHEGNYYCGFQFTMPEWLDGDFDMLFLLAKTEQNKDVIPDQFCWFCIPKSGPLLADVSNRRPIFRFLRLRNQFPYTKHVIHVMIGKEEFKPGQTYAFGFRYNQTNAPDIAFSMSIQSHRGYNEFGCTPTF
jgi:hypothetical protein